jgi:dUTP pyrophosphatase
MTLEHKYEIYIRIKFFRNAAAIYNQSGPLSATHGSAGFDLRADIGPELEKSVNIAPGERFMIETGIAIEALANGIAGFVYSRSGLGAIAGLTIAQGVGLIDPDYRGEIKIALLNTSSETHTVKRGDRIAQLVLQPFYRASFIPVEELGQTERGESGFGHTGNK